MRPRYDGLMTSTHMHRCEGCFHRQECDGEDFTGATMGVDTDSHPDPLVRMIAAMAGSEGCDVEGDCPNCRLIELTEAAEDEADRLELAFLPIDGLSVVFSGDDEWIITRHGVAVAIVMGVEDYHRLMAMVA